MSHLIQLVLALLRIVDGRLIAVVKQMARSYKAITPIVTRTAGYQYSFALAQRLQLEHCLALAQEII